jgi:hypothetical protein
LRGRIHLACIAAVLLAAPMCAAGTAVAGVANPDPALIVRWEPCEPNAGVTVIVDEGAIGAEKVAVGCALGEQSDALEALKHAGFTPAGTANYGLAFICRIDGEPTLAEQECESTPPADAYWSYWRGKPGGQWSYSTYGVTSPKTRSPVNSVEGWAFGEGSQPRVEPLDGGGPDPYEAGFEPQSLSFEARPVGSPAAALTATLTSHDTRPFQLGALEVAGPQAGDFTVAGQDCTGRTLTSGESCQVSVGFDPGAAGADEALLVAAIEGSPQQLELPLGGTGTSPSGTPEGVPPTGGSSPAGSSSGSQGTLGFVAGEAPGVHSLRLDGDGVGEGLVGVSWQPAGAGVSSWTIAARVLGSRDAYTRRVSGAGSVTSALVTLPPGLAYQLELTLTGPLGQSTTTSIGRVVVPHDARWSGLLYRGHWQRRTEAGAWMNTLSRGGAGEEVSAQLPPGHPLFTLRGGTRGAVVEVLAGSRHQLLSLAGIRAGAGREIVSAFRARSGTVTLRVLHGTVDLDGVAVER